MLRELRPGLHSVRVGGVVCLLPVSLPAAAVSGSQAAVQADSPVSQAASWQVLSSPPAGGVSRSDCVSRSESDSHLTVISDGVWPSPAISTSGLSETEMFFVRDQTGSEWKVRDWQHSLIN